MTFHPDSLPDLTGRTYLITGGNSGIGKYTVAHLARRGAHVYMGSRSAAKAEVAIQGLQAEYPDDKLHITQLTIDHLSLASVVKAAKELQSRESSLHGLVNNAGIMATPYALSSDGYDVQFQTNYLAHWLLTYHLLPLLQKTALQLSAQPGAVRIVNVSSIGHQQAPTHGINFENTGLKDCSPMERYGQSKLAQILHADTLHRTYGPGSSKVLQSGGCIWTTSVNPGLVQTNLGAHDDFPRWMRWVAVPAAWLGLAWTSDKGSWTSLYCAASEQMKETESGAYFIRLANPKGSRSAYALDVELAERLETWTVEEMKKKGFLVEGAAVST
jgi:NAD(P)-dependent dehydrogenase (short-subunit alcohol dehydrogenase family)